MLKTFLSEVLNNFLGTALFGLFIVFGLGYGSVFPDLEFDGGFELHGVVLIKNSFTFDLCKIIIIFGNGDCINLRLLIFIS